MEKLKAVLARRMCPILEDMELLPPVTWVGIGVSAGFVGLESYVLQQPTPGMDFLAAVPPLRPGCLDFI